ncbi:uncharacterized protein N7482_001537 [Penicillium canariense]|uniref:NB-ARC domain-containing protein n=1 Tax=Penicillium canariense TaxID=189055 RepID=A0A9W9IGT5_9EURO|nr:uncharacterized protein N7482_001537 [Penicillium canariense]KAJ5175660.1 hypothetical protein N7482_001537 [Penicillium canariense]
MYHLLIFCSRSLIAVHGLNGHREQTWTASNQINWLRDLLPSDIPNARILTYGYDARTHGTNDLTAQFLYEHAITFLGKLCIFRRNTKAKKRPIIFLAHSLGGILVKSHLRANSEWLGMQLDQFTPISADFEIVFCYESYKTPVLLGQGVLIVPRESATVAGYPRSTSFCFSKNHTELVRFKNAKDEDYITVMSHLKDMISRCIQRVKINWSELYHSEAETVTKDIRRTVESSKICNLPFALPVERSPVFAGRSSHLREMHEYLCPEESQVEGGIDELQQCRVVVLYGLGGMGKTQLAIAYALQQKQHLSAVLWLDGSSKGSSQLGFRDIAQRYIDASKQVTTLGNSSLPIFLSETLPDICKKTVSFLESEYSGKWLLIIDNMDELLGYPISDFLPRAFTGKVIITSRLTGAVNFGKPIEVDEIEEEAAVSILMDTALLRLKAPSDTSHARIIAKALGYLPLAIEQAGAYISDVQISLDDYLPLYEKARSQLLNPATSLVNLAPKKAVFATWEASFARIQSHNDAAAELLLLMSFLHHSSIWEGLFLGFPGKGRPIAPSSAPDFAWLSQLCQDSLKLKHAVGNIISVSLAKRGPLSGSIYLHPLVHTWGRERLSPERRARKLIHALIVVGQALEHVSRQAMTKEIWEFRQQILPHADSCINLAEEEKSQDIFESIFADAVAVKAFFYTVTLLQDIGRLKEAERYLDMLVQLKPSTICPELYANAQRRLAEILNYYSRYEEARNLFKEAEISLTQLFGPSHPDTLAAQVGLGDGYFQSARILEAEHVLKRALDNDTSDAGRIGKHGRLAASVLGLVYQNQGFYSDALELLDRALEDAADDVDGEILNSLMVKYRRAIILQDLGYWKAAETTFKEVLQARQKILGHNHVTTLRVLNALGRLSCWLGKYKESRELLDLAWQGQEKLGFSSENETAQLRTLYNIGALNCAEGMFDEAFECLNRALKSQQKLYGEAAGQVLDVKLDLGILYTEKGVLETAVSTLESVLETRQRRNPGGVVSLIRSRTALADALLCQGRTEEAEEILRPAIADAETSLKPDNPDRLRMETSVAMLQFHKGHGHSALPALELTIQLLGSTLGENHPMTIQAEGLLAQIYFQEGRKEQAADMIKEVVEKMGALVGLEHPKTKKFVQLRISMTMSELT